MQVPPKAVQSLTGSPATVFHALCYHDAAAAEASSPRDILARLRSEQPSASGRDQTDAQQVDQLADILDDDASDMDVFAQGSPRISMGGSSFADESKVDDASSSLLESKDFQMHGSGGFDSDA